MKTKKKINDAMTFIVLMGIVSLFSDMTYRACFAVLGIPALITIGLVIFSKIKYPYPEMFDKTPEEKTEFRFSWLLGALYDTNPLILVVVSVCVQLTAIGFYAICLKTQNNEQYI